MRASWVQDLAEIVKPDPVGSIPSLSAHPRRLVEPSDSIVSSCVLQCPHLQNAGDDRVRLCSPNAGDLGYIPGQGTKIPHAAWFGQKKNADDNRAYLRGFL